MKISDFRTPDDGGIVSEHGTQPFNPGGTSGGNDFYAFDGINDLGIKDKKTTYLCLVAHAAPSIEEVIDLIFFGHVYFKDNSNFLKETKNGSIDTERWEGKKYKFFCNEVDGLNELEHIQLYYGYVIDKDLGVGGGYVYNSTSDKLDGTD